MMQEDYRDHYSKAVGIVLIEIAAVYIIIWIFLRFLSSISDRLPNGIVICVEVLIGVALAVSEYLSWRATRYIFTDAELIKVSKLEVNAFQYSTLAKITVDRGRWNRAFGAARIGFFQKSVEEKVLPDVTLVLKAEQAEDLSRRLNEKIFGITPAPPVDPDTIPSLVHVSDTAIALNFICAAPRSVWLLAMLALCAAVWELYTGSIKMAIVCTIALLMIVSPTWRTIRRYRDFRIHREGDVITVHRKSLGDVSFRIGMICCVRCRKVFTGRYVLNANVISKDGRRRFLLLCPMKKKDEVMGLFERLLPEFCLNGEAVGSRAEPSWARALRSAPVAAVWAGLFLCAYDWYRGIGGSSDHVASIILAVGAIGALAVIICSAWARGKASITLGENLFLYRDRSSGTYVAYDRIQFLNVASKFFQRRYGAGYLSVNVPAVYGHKAKHFGTFDLELLSKVPDIVLARIREGRCDPGTRP